LQYKFGILLVKQGQTTDNEYFSNVEGSDYYDEFLQHIGNIIVLNGHTGFAGGLDSTWRHYSTSEQ